MPVHLEVVVLGDLGFDRREIAAGKFDHGPTFAAHQMVVMVPAAQAVGGLPFVLADRVDQAGVGERDKCAVDRGQAELCALALGACMDLMRGECAAALQCVHHGHPLRGAPQSVLPKCETDIHTSIVVPTPNASGDRPSPARHPVSAIVHRTEGPLPAHPTNPW